MRAVLAVGFLSAVLLVTANAGGQTVPTPQAPPLVSVLLTTTRVHDTAHTRADYMLIWNKNEQTLPIGHATRACIKAGTGGVLGGGVMTCVMVISLPRGKVTATGEVHSVDRYTLVITGGTGVYKGAMGPLFVRRVLDGIRRMTFTL